ncbi:MAG: class I SAM-dependent methyltransferase [Dehalococcoidia bacterium]|jgi:SAM-dependent methyltransferase|nr:class I SAM-dependent methyltransferase [Dehalococcoidia bacterium]
MTNPDFGRAAKDYARHRGGFPPEFFDSLDEIAIDVEGARIVDLGTGAGTLARGFARRGAEVIAIDISEDLMREARRLDRESGVGVEYVTAPAEETGLPAGEFDIVAAGQCWWWFDPGAALAEATRLLKPGGALLLASWDWIPQPGNVVDLTERLIESHNPDWLKGGGNGLHPEFIVDLQGGGFEAVTQLTFPLDDTYTHESWRGRVRASAGVAASLSQDRVDVFDQELAALLAERFPGDPIAIPHRVFAAAGRKPI